MKKLLSGALPTSMSFRKFCDTMILLILSNGFDILFHLLGACPCQRCIALHLMQILKASSAKPLLNSKNLLLLFVRILFVSASFGPFNVFQEYVSFRILSLQARGSVPQNSRIIAGLVERGQLIRVFSTWVWKHSNSSHEAEKVDCIMRMSRIVHRMQGLA